MLRATVVAQGITGLHGYIRRAHPNCISSSRIRLKNLGREPRGVDYLFVDINNLLYPFANKSEKEFGSRLFASLDAIITNVGKPLHCLYLGIDGPGPYSKIPVQQKRRLTAWRSQNLDDPIAPGFVNPLNFTPGTKLLARLSEALIHYCATRMTVPTSPTDSQPSLPKLLRSVVSSADVPGEGEFKIFQFLRTQSTEFSSREEGTFPHTAIVSGDSDLILFSLRAGYYLGRIDIWMSSQTFTARSPCTIYSIGKLRREIIGDVLEQEGRSSLACQQIIDDWVLLNLLRGSDLLPGLSEFNFELTWERYKSHKGSLPIWNEQKKSVDLLALCKVLVAGRSRAPSSSATVRLPLQDLFRVVMIYAGIKWKTVNHEPSGQDSSGRVELNIEGTPFVTVDVAGTTKTAVSASTKQLFARALSKIHQEPEGRVAQRLRSTLSPTAFATTWEKIGEALQTLPPTATAEIPESDPAQLVEQYAAALAWNMEYLRGRCTDWGFTYHAAHAPAITKESAARVKARALHKEQRRPPLDPLMLGMLVLPREILADSYSHEQKVLRLLDDSSPITDILPPRNMMTLFETNQFLKSLPPLSTCVARIQEACAPILDTAKLPILQSAVIMQSFESSQTPYTPPSVLTDPPSLVPTSQGVPSPTARIEVVPLIIDPLVDYV